MDLATDIADLIAAAVDMKNQAGSDKQALNKTISKLQDARLWATQIHLQQPTATQQACLCPNGATNSLCPIHGK